MKQAPFVHGIEKYRFHLRQFKHTIPSHLSVESCHDFRVEIKKLRALLSLTAETRENKSKPHLTEALLALYRAVGDLRSLQLQQQLVSSICTALNCPVPATYLLQLQKKEKEAREIIRRQAKQVSWKKLHTRLHKGLPQQIEAEDLQRYVAKKQTELLAYLSVFPVTDETLHDIRKLLKNLLYVWPWVENALLSLLPASAPTKAYYQQLSEDLGVFQDYCTALTFFTPRYTAKLGEEEKARVHSIQRECLQRKGLQKRKVAETLMTLQFELRVGTVPTKNAPACTY